jgi:hypothetical protein
MRSVAPYTVVYDVRRCLQTNTPTMWRFLDESKKSSNIVGGFLCVDFNTSFINQLATELQYLVWVLNGEYE